MIEGAFALAFTAGLVATVNPCGFAMLPAYLSYFMGLEDAEARPGRIESLRQGFVVGGVVSAGFVLVFAVVGLPLTLGLRSIIDVLPWAAIVIGAGLVVLGVALLGGYELTVGLPKLDKGGGSRRYRSVFLFGVSYAVASLSCTLPVFLAVVAGAIPRTNLLSGVLLFVVYGLGMALTLMAITLVLALGKSALLGWLRRSARHVNRAAGAVLVLAGAYIIWFWATNLRDPLAASGPIRFVEGLSARLTNLIGNSPWLSAGILAGVVVLAAAVALLARRGGGPQPPRSPQGTDGGEPAEEVAATEVRRAST